MVSPAEKTLGIFGSLSHVKDKAGSTLHTLKDLLSRFQISSLVVEDLIDQLKKLKDDLDEIIIEENVFRLELFWPEDPTKLELMRDLLAGLEKCRASILAMEE